MLISNPEILIFFLDTIINSDQHSRACSCGTRLKVIPFQVSFVLLCHQTLKKINVRIGSSELLPGSGVENTYEASGTASKTPERKNTILRLVIEFYFRPKQEFKRVNESHNGFSHCCFSESRSSVSADVNNAMSTIEKVEYRKRKIDTEISNCSDEEVKNKKGAISEKLSKKMEELYSEL